jgi:hypothetical protein
MRLINILLCGIVLVCITGCNSPASDGKKAAELAMEMRDVNLDHSYDSDEVQNAAKAYDEFASECREKYDGDPKSMEEFEAAFNDAIKADMQKQPN